MSKSIKSPEKNTETMEAEVETTYSDPQLFALKTYK